MKKTWSRKSHVRLPLNRKRSSVFHFCFLSAVFIFMKVFTTKLIYNWSVVWQHEDFVHTVFLYPRFLYNRDNGLTLPPQLPCAEPENRPYHMYDWWRHFNDVSSSYKQNSELNSDLSLILNNSYIVKEEQREHLCAGGRGLQPRRDKPPRPHRLFGQLSSRSQVYNSYKVRLIKNLILRYM